MKKQNGIRRKAGRDAGLMSLLSFYFACFCFFFFISLSFFSTVQYAFAFFFSAIELLFYVFLTLGRI